MEGNNLDVTKMRGEIADYFATENLAGFFRRFCLRQQFRAGGDRGQRIAPIVSEHGDELLAQFRGLALGQQLGLGGVRRSTASGWVAISSANA
jgi:hypothetical protein